MMSRSRFLKLRVQVPLQRILRFLLKASEEVKDREGKMIPALRSRQAVGSNGSPKPNRSCPKRREMRRHPWSTSPRSEKRDKDRLKRALLMEQLQL